MGCVYLIHFAKKFSHAQHYIGYCSRSKPDKRLEKHRKGAGAKLMRAVTEAGIEWECVRVWKNGTRDFERSLKNRKNTRMICPRCDTKKAMAKATNSARTAGSSPTKAGPSGTGGEPAKPTRPRSTASPKSDSQTRKRADGAESGSRGHELP